MREMAGDVVDEGGGLGPADAIARGQRGWKGQPGGGSIGLGGSPPTGVARPAAHRKIGHGVEQHARIGMARRANNASVSPISTSRPRYITPTRFAMKRTTARLWVIKR